MCARTQPQKTPPPRLHRQSAIATEANEAFVLLASENTDDAIVRTVVPVLLLLLLLL